MAIYNFENSVTFANIPRGIASAAVAGAAIQNPTVSPYAPGVSQTSHVENGRVANTWEEGRVSVGDVEDFIEPAFKYLDSAMKNYWSDIRIPTKDSYRFVRAKIAGASKSLQIWTDDLRHGRVRLPVISISRTNHTYNPAKFTPPYGALRKRYLDAGRTMAALGYRPIPYNVDYSLTLWAEHKRDAEYALYQILTRFNPLAELRASDDHNVGYVQMTLNGAPDSSEKEAAADQQAKIKYEVNYIAEAWLSIPEKIVPLISGSVYSISESIITR